MQICIFEDQQVNNFLPLVYFRPVYALRCGATELRQKVERLFPKAAITYHIRRELADYLQEIHPDSLVNDLTIGPAWFVNGRVLADSKLPQLLQSSPRGDTVYFNGESVVAAFAGGESVRALKDGLKSGPLPPNFFEGFTVLKTETPVVHYPWELVHRNAAEIQKDFEVLATRVKTIAGKIHPGAHLLNRKDILIGKRSVVKPGAVLDAEKGPIIVGEEVSIYPNAVIEGPAFIGDKSIVKPGARIYAGTSIGNVCKVGGEVDTSIIHSFSNKQHDGFLGHSYLGSWVNIGADTNNSDLKNNYGTVEVVLNGESVDTGLQFVGLFMGDHSKTGINVMFDTGSVVGVSCNVYGAGLPPKFLPSFSWGNPASPFTTYRLEKSIDTAKRVMARRNVEWTASYEQLFRAVFEATTSERTRARIF